MRAGRRTTISSSFGHGRSRARAGRRLNEPVTATCWLRLLLVAAVLLSTFSCSALQPAMVSDDATVQPGVSPLETQALVMSMADDYIAALGESVYLLARTDELSPKGRTLAQSFLRNGVGASLDIGSGPNPPVSLLDLLVLASLQTWSFETHWIPAGIGHAGAPALERLREAEIGMWASARQVLSEDQLVTLRELIDAWIKDNPDRTVVALVRFEEFADDRKISALHLHGRATGLLREVSDASGAIDDARLLGERLIWFAGRYPFLLGEQTELTAYRLIDQPEGAQLIETIASIRELATVVTERMKKIDGDMPEWQASFFSRVAAERAATIDQAQESLEATVQQSLDDATERINAERVAAIEQLFDRFARERTLFLDDLESRQNELRGLMAELRDTISVSGTLAHELTATVDAIDRVVSRFDTDPESNREPLSMTDIRDAAIETTRAAEQMTRVLELTNELIESRALDERIASVTDPAETIVDRAFWRGAMLIGLLIGGLALLRLVPQRVDKKRTA